MDTKIAVVTIPAHEWENLKQIVYGIESKVNSLIEDKGKTLVTPEEAMKYLNISRSTYEKHKNDGTLKVVKIGGKKYSKNMIRLSDLESLVKDSII